MKHHKDVLTSAELKVAPHAGAWIETGEVKRLKEEKRVAPHAGAWIETQEEGLVKELNVSSRPTRARGLKHS